MQPETESQWYLQQNPSKQKMKKDGVLINEKSYAMKNNFENQEHLIFFKY